MNNRFLSIYAMIACVFCLIGMLVALAITLSKTLDYFSDTQGPYDYSYLEDNESFKEHFSPNPQGLPPLDWEKPITIPNDEAAVTQLRLQFLEKALKVKKRVYFSQMTTFLPVLFLFSVAFWIHWRLLKKNS